MSNDKYALLIDNVQKFLKKNLEAQALEFDQYAIIPSQFISLMAEKGYLGMNVHQDYGGSASDEITIGLVNKEFAKYSPSVRSILTVQGMVTHIISSWGNAKQKEKWLPLLSSGSCIGGFALAEPQSGCDAGALTCEAVKCADGYLLSGKKVWVTMGQAANLFIVFCKYNGLPGAVIVEKSDGVKIMGINNLSGLKSTMVADLEFNNTFISDDNVIASWGVGLNQVAFSALEYGRYTVAWGCVGIAERCIELTCRYANERVQFQRKIKDNQLIKKMITEMITEYKAAAALCKSAGELRDEKSPESIMETWIAKYHASKMVNEVVSRAVQILGASSCKTDNLVEMFYRDVRMFEIIEGTTQMHELFIADCYL